MEKIIKKNIYYTVRINGITINVDTDNNEVENLNELMEYLIRSIYGIIYYPDIKKIYFYENGSQRGTMSKLFDIDCDNWEYDWFEKDISDFEDERNYKDFYNIIYNLLDGKVE